MHPRGGEHACHCGAAPFVSRLTLEPLVLCILASALPPGYLHSYHTDPSGTYIRYDAKAIGSGSEGAQSALQEDYHSSLTLEEVNSMSCSGGGLRI